MSVKGCVYVVVITYNGEDDIQKFLKTYCAYTSPDARLIVVDNASSDRTVDSVRQQCPDAIVLQNTINRGYAGGARQGMEYALANDAHYIAVVNQDLHFSEQWLEPLVEYLDSHEQCAAVQPRIMMYPNTNAINSYGNAQHFLGFGYTLGYQCAAEGNSISRLTDAPAYPCENGKKLATCSGAAVLFRAAALQNVGLIDEKFFMYYEDSDVSWRLRLAGYTLALCCDSTVYHRYEFSRSIQKFYYMERNRLILMLSNYSLIALFFIFPMVMIMEAGMVGYSLIGTVLGKKDTVTLKEKLRSYGYFFRPSSWIYLAKKRRHAQGLRRVSDKNITELFVSTIEFQDIDNAVLRNIANPLMRWYWRFTRRLL